MTDFNFCLDETLLGSNGSSNVDVGSFDFCCLLAKETYKIYLVFFGTSVFLLLPLCLIVIYYGVQQQLLKRSTTTASDSFTYQTIVFDLIGISGCVLTFYGINSKTAQALSLGCLLWFFSWCGETMFHALTCLEHYLAVVHPIAYVRLKNQRGFGPRHVSIICAWLMCFMGLASMFKQNVFIVLSCCTLSIVVLFVSYCILSVLFVLIRPGPGEKEAVNQSKKRAFYTILAVLGALILRFSGSLIWMIVYSSKGPNYCLILASLIWFFLPSCLVLPLLFLHRVGKLTCH